MIAVFVGLAVFGDAHDQKHYPEWFVMVDLFCGAAACIALFWRRRWPVGLTIALIVVAAYASSPAAPRSWSSSRWRCTARSGRSRRSPRLVIASQPLYLAIFPQSNTPYWVDVALSVLIVCVAVVWGMFVRARRQLVLSLRDRAERAETEQQLRVEQARQHERARIAREMHDVLAHRISLLSLHAGALEFRPTRRRRRSPARPAVIRSSAHQALEDLRAVLGVLREEPTATSPSARSRPWPTCRLVEASAQAACAWRPRGGSPRRSVGTGGAGPHGVPDRAGGADQRAQARRATAVTSAVGGGRAPGWPSRCATGGRSARPQPPRSRGPGRAWSGWPSGRGWPAAGSSTGRTEAGDFRLPAWLPWPA